METEERRAWQPDALADEAGEHGEREGRRDEEHDEPEGAHLVHSPDARRIVCCRCSERFDDDCLQFVNLRFNYGTRQQEILISR